MIEAIHYLDFEKGDLTSLGKLLEIASKIDPELFTESSYEGFEKAYQTAQDVYDLGGDALKGDVESAYSVSYTHLDVYKRQGMQL